MTDLSSLLRELRPGLTNAVTRMVGYSIIVGVVAGLAALAFSHTVETVSSLCIRQICGVELPTEGKHVDSSKASEGGAATTYRFQVPPWEKRIWILIVPAIGGLLCGWLVFTFAPEAEGHGTDSVIEAFHQKRGVIRKRVPLIKLVSSVLTLSTGGCAGREGPIAQISAGVGSALADVFKLSARQRRILVVAGVGAGVGAMFRAPLGGALFAVDVLYRDTEFESEALIPAFIASIVSYTTFALLTPAGMGAIFNIPAGLALTHPSHLLLCVLLSVVLAVMGVLYTKIFYGVTALFRNRVRIKPYLKPMLGGLIVGVVGVADPRLLTTGYGWVQEAIDGNLGPVISDGAHWFPWFMTLLIATKILLTAVTVGSGGSGGVFGPSIVIGGLIGGAFGVVCQHWIPSVDPAVFVLLGMSGFFAGAAKVPISTIIMVSEMTVGYALLLPLMLVSSLTYLLSPKQVSIYIKQVARRVDSNAHLGDFVVDILQRIQVSEIMSPEEEWLSVHETMGIRPLLEQVSQSPNTTFPVLNDAGDMTGMIRFDDLRGAFMQPDLAGLIISKDIAVTRFEYIYPDDNLSDALKKISSARCAELPVVEGPKGHRVLAMLSRHRLVQAYSAAMEDLMREKQAETKSE